MKNAVPFAVPLLFVAACSQPTTNAGNMAQADMSKVGSAADAGAHKPQSIGKGMPEHAGIAHERSMDMAAMTPAAGDSEATRGSKAAMMKMMHAMPPYTGDADVDFNKQMRGHHVAAIEMADVQLKHGKDPTSRALAQEIVVAQKREIAAIDAWLAKRGQPAAAAR